MLVAAALASASCANNQTVLPALDDPVLAGPEGVLKSPEQQATEQATAAITRYYQVLSGVLSGATAEAELASVASAPYLQQLQREVHDLKSPEVRIAGTVRAGAVAPVKIVAPQDREKAPIPGQAQAEMRVCEDRAGLTVTGKPADSLPSAARLRRFVLTNPQWPAGQWVIERQFAMPDTACDKPY